MSGTRFDLVLADGRRLESVRIQGSGGEVGAACPDPQHTSNLDRIRVVVRRATAGKSLPVYEPMPGHVKAYFGPFNCGRSEAIDVRGATISLSVAS